MASFFGLPTELRSIIWRRARFEHAKAVLNLFSPCKVRSRKVWFSAVEALQVFFCISRNKRMTLSKYLPAYRKYDLAYDVRQDNDRVLTSLVEYPADKVSFDIHPYIRTVKLFRRADDLESWYTFQEAFED